MISICLADGVARSLVDQPCAYLGPGGFFILLPVTRLMVSLKQPSGCSVSSSGWPSTTLPPGTWRAKNPGPTHTSWSGSFPRPHFASFTFSTPATFHQSQPQALCLIPSSIRSDVFGYTLPLEMISHRSGADTRGPPFLPGTLSFCAQLSPEL